MVLSASDLIPKLRNALKNIFYSSVAVMNNLEGARFKGPPL